MNASLIVSDFMSGIGSCLVLIVLTIIGIILKSKRKMGGVLLYLIGLSIQLISFVGQAKYLFDDRYWQPGIETQVSRYFWTLLFFAVAGGIVLACVGKNRFVYYCTKCDKIWTFQNADEDKLCPWCNNKLASSGIESREWDRMTVDQVNKKKNEMSGTENKTETEEKRGEAKKKVFQCRVCNTYSKYKLKTCPHCSAIDTMIEQYVDDDAEIEFYESSLGTSSEKSSKLTYCRKCGCQLIEGSSFCRKCGASIFDLQNETKKTALSEEEIVTEKQTKTEEAPLAKDIEPSESDAVIEIDFSDNQLPPKIKRAFLFIEDGEWERADSYLEAVLDDDPTNASAYIGKLMIEKKISKTEDLFALKGKLNDNKYFQKALRFSDGKLHNQLDALKKQDIKKDSIGTNMRVAIPVDGGMLWVDGETAEKIASGEIDPNRKLTKEEEQASLDAAMSFMNFEK